MTKNQLDYLSLEETKRHQQATEQEAHRNNLVIEQQGADRNAETKRNNLVVSKETRRHDKATEKQAKQNAKVNIKTTKISSSTAAAAGREAARISASASRYSADVRAATDLAGQANQRAISSAKNKTDMAIQKTRNETSKFLKSVDKLMQNKDLTQKERDSLRKMYTQLKVNNDKLSADATQKELDRQVKLLSNAGGILAGIGKSLGYKEYNKDVDKAAHNLVKRGITTQYYPGTYREITGAQPASGIKTGSTDSSKKSKSKGKSKVVINTKPKSQRKSSSIKGAQPIATFTRNPIAKVQAAKHKLTKK